MTPFDIHPAAQNEFREIIRYYSAIDEDAPEKPLASAFVATFQHHLKLILEAPELFRLRRPPTRRVNLTPRFGEHYIAYTGKTNNSSSSPSPTPNAAPTTGGHASPT